MENPAKGSNLLTIYDHAGTAIQRGKKPLRILQNDCYDNSPMQAACGIPDPYSFDLSDPFPFRTTCIVSSGNFRYRTERPLGDHFLAGHLGGRGNNFHFRVSAVGLPSGHCSRKHIGITCGGFRIPGYFLAVTWEKIPDNLFAIPWWCRTHFTPGKSLDEQITWLATRLITAPIYG